MGLFDRLSAMLRSNINDLISRAENPEKMLNQLILDMKTQLAKAKQQVASAIADERKLQSDAEALKKQAEDWERRAMMAVQEGRDDLAKQALGRYNEQLQAAQQLQETWLRHKAETDQLKLSLRQLNDKIEEAKRKKNILVARSKRAEAQQRIQETMSGLSDKSAFESFERMAEKIEATERKALAAAELNEEVSGDLLARQFEALEYKGSSDQQLIELKTKMGILSSGPWQRTRSSWATGRRGRPRRRADRGGGRREVALTHSAETERRRGFPLGWVLLAVIVVALAIRTIDVLLVVFLAIILAVYLDAVSGFLQRRLECPRSVALGSAAVAHRWARWSGWSSSSRPPWRPGAGLHRQPPASS